MAGLNSSHGPLVSVKAMFGNKEHIEGNVKEILILLILCGSISHKAFVFSKAY
jgi:hypothetical protein